MMASWHGQYLVEPFEELLTLVPVGDEVRDWEKRRTLATGVESVFHNELRHQYAGWPPESTTDRASVDVCVRSGVASLDVAGLMWIDFADEVFPFRAEIGRTDVGSVAVTGYVGQIDEISERVPRLPSGTLVIPVRDEHDRNPVPELIVGRRQVAIAWTKVFEWSTHE